eukprot:21770_1
MGGNEAPPQEQAPPQGLPPPQPQMYSDPAPPDQGDMKLQFGAHKAAAAEEEAPPQAMDYSAFGGGGGGAQEPDAATAALIAQMMAAEKCVVCSKNQGFELSCGDNVCAPCGKKYILNGIATGKWKKGALVCPNPSGCSGILPLWIVAECGLGAGMQAKLEEMQNKYMIDSDPSITSCPKCKETYSTEVGDMNAVSVSEKGPDGKLLSLAHRQHKAKFRFRCSGRGCRTIFCSGCYVTPYHTGYTCSEYKRYRESKKCRFCEVSLDASNTAPKDSTLKAGLDCVCTGAECLEKRRWSCDVVHPCGHNCIGLMGHECIPCLNEKCLSKQAAAELNEEEYCNICWVDPLRAAPCVKLTCKHYFHFMCLWQKIDRKWPAARITFGFLNCPLCKTYIHHPALDDITKKYYDLKEEIQKDAIERVKLEGLSKDKRMADPNSPYYKNLPKFALDRLAFYPCSKCKKPYFGGMKACEEAGLEQAESYKQEH